MRLGLLGLESLNCVVEVILVGLKVLRRLADRRKSGWVGEDLIEVFYRIIIV